MAEQYNEVVAAHYGAYRPPLHRRILKHALGAVNNLGTGLDAGCGTGRSALALAEFCDYVYALDPSPSMLEAATPHPAITYLHGSSEAMPLPDRSIDVATFAGSLFYANSKRTVQEIRRVCRHGAFVIPYDFEVQLDGVVQRFGFVPRTFKSTYNSRVNFSGVSAFEEMLLTNERIQLDMDATDLAHILLADSARHAAFVSRYETATPHVELSQEIDRFNPSNSIGAYLHCSVYRLAEI